MADPDFDKMSPEEIAQYQRQNCIFCKIIKGEIPSRQVYEDEKVISILDINPAAKGHLLIMTKEHYPFLPVIPPELQAHLFKITKGLSKALKQALVTDKTTVFIANGGIAGQQSPHFLYHIVPREVNDGLDNFTVPAKELAKEEVDKFMPTLKGKLGLIMRDYQAKFSPVKETPKQSPPQAPMQEKREAINSPELAQLIMENPQLKEMIIKDPAGFKAELDKNPELKKLFGSVDIAKLSLALGSMKGS